MTTLAWKINRIKLMGMSEVIWRAQQVIQKKTSKFGFGLVANVPEADLRHQGKSLFSEQTCLPNDDALLKEADAILAGYWSVFALRDVKLGFPPQWNRDPKTGTVAPMMQGKLIDYRSERVVGDIKYLWEPSRHLELVTLAQAWRASHEQRYADGARELLQSWFVECPYPNGVHWTSSLELAVRLVNWSMAWQLFGGLDSPLFVGLEGQQFQREWLNNIYRHCHFISGYFSKHSSANNHLFGEYMGLFIASLTWPFWHESTVWREIAQSGLEAEALKQNTVDGVNKEQAVYYQHEVMDMMLLCYLAGQANGLLFSASFTDRLERMAEFLSSLLDVGGHMPMIGDADDAQMVRLAYGADWCPYRSLLASCAVIFQRADFKRKSIDFDDKNDWLFGASGRAVWESLQVRGEERPVMAFNSGGYYLLGHRFGSLQEVRLVADCAPLGYLSIAAHGHADALAFTLSIGGEEFLIDPGTYAYHTQKVWRDYFRSTAAHNTLEVDGHDQSEIGGNFMWLRKANASLIQHEVGEAVQVFEGEHDGYCRLADPVRHRRRIEFDTRKNVILVKDILQCQREHKVALHWHFAEACTVEQTADGLRVSGRGGDVLMRSFKGVSGPILLRGSDSPIGGWISRRFDKKVPITTAVWQGVVNGSTEITTELQINFARGSEN